MRRLIVILVVAIVVALSLAIVSVASASTPTPTATPTETPSPTSPVLVPPDVARFDINLWVDGHQDWKSKIVPMIGDVVCGGETQEPISPPDSGVVEHFVAVQSDASLPGCGTPGAVTTFFVDGRKVDRMAAWSAEQHRRVVLTEGPKWVPGTFQSLTLIVGPSFARVCGNAGPQLVVSGKVVPFIGSTACGYQENAWQGEAPPFGYGVVVYSREIKAGCGYEGATITFRVVDDGGSVIVAAEQTATWHAWDGTSDTVQTADPTFLPAASISAGGFGTGDSWSRGRSSSCTAGLALAIGGVGSVLAGAALRKRTAR